MTQLYVQTLGYNDRVLEAVRRGKPALLKVVDPDKGYVDALHQASPETMIIGRIVDDHQGKLTAAEARVFAGRVIDKAHELDAKVLWWEGSNEAIAGGIEDMKRLNDFELTFAEYIQKEGLHALVGGFSTGVPDITDGGTKQVPWMREWEAFYPAMRVAHGVHFHEYWHPHRLDDRWNAYRYQMWWPALPDWAKQKWWLISEFGIDGGLAGDGRKGWQDYVSEPRYLQLLKEYNAELTKYPKVAVAIYIAGLGVDQSWRGFDISDHGLMSELANGWANSGYKWGVVDTISDGGEKPEMDVRKFDKLLRDRFQAAGIEYDNLIGHFKDQAGAAWLTKRRDFKALHGVALHHSAGAYNGSTQSIYEANVARGLGGFAYHAVAYCYRNSSGKIWRKFRLLRNPQDYGAHVKDNNHEWVGVVWPGAYHQNVPDVEVQKAQAEMLAIFVKALREYASKPDLQLNAHGAILPGYTECPDGGRWFRSSFVPLFEKAMAGDVVVPDDDYTRGWNDALSHAIQSLSVELEKLRR